MNTKNKVLSLLLVTMLLTGLVLPLTAFADGETYTVSFDPGTGTGSMEAVTVGAGESYTLPACTFTHANSERAFYRWSVGGELKAPGEPITVNADTTVTAKWQHTTSTTIDNAVDSSTTTVVSHLILRDTRTGTEREEDIGSETTASSFTNPSNPTVTAMIAEAQEALSQKAQEDAVGSAVTILSNDVSTLMVTDYADDRTFTYFDNGFDDAGDYCRYLIIDGIYWKKWQYTVTLEAEYESPAPCTVSFAPGTGTGSMASVTVTEGEEYTLPACTFTHTNSERTFYKWSVGGELKDPGDTITVSADTTVTALWVYTASSSLVNNTQDNSTTNYVGKLVLTDTRTGETVTEELYNETVASTYSNPMNSDVASLAGNCVSTLNTALYSYPNANFLSDDKPTLDADHAEIVDSWNHITYRFEEAPDEAGDYVRTMYMEGDYGNTWRFTETVTGSYTSAEPVTAYTVTVNAATNGSVSADKTSAAAGETVTLTVTPDSGCELDTLTVTDASSSTVTVNADNSFTMPASNVTVTAAFKLAYRNLALGATAGGYVDAQIGDLLETDITNAGGLNSTTRKDASVTLTATPDSGYIFKGWYRGVIGSSYFVEGNDGTLLSSGAAYSFTLNENTNLQAVFEAANYIVTVTASPAAGGTVSGGGTFDGGGSVTVTATPAKSCRFVNWTEGGTEVSTEASYTFTAAADRTLTANFAPIPVYTVTIVTDGGSVPADKTVTEGGRIARPADPVKDGAVFAGWYGDAAFTTTFDFDAPITADTTVYARWTPASYVLTSVAGTTADAAHTWTKGSGSDVVLTVKLNDGIDHSFAHFTGVQFDGAALVSGTDYTAEEGSTVVTLNAAALERLSTAVHTVKVLFDNGEVSTALTVAAAAPTPTATPAPTSAPTATPAPTTNNAASPRTGDDTAAGRWSALTLVSGLALAGLALAEWKRQRTGR